MQARRPDRTDEYELPHPDDTLLAAESLRPKANATSRKGNDEERMSLFWRVFGGTILSICALVAITLFNNFSNTLTEIRADIAKLNEARADSIRKDEFNARTTNTWDRVQVVQGQVSTQAATVSNLQSEIAGLKERLTKQGLDLDAVRKDSTTTADALKKDLAAYDVLKERILALESLKKDFTAIDVAKEKIAALSAESKTVQDDLKKVRADVDRNVAADEERKKRRDSIQLQVDAAIKDLTKGLQDCREKLAWLEGALPPGGKKDDKSKASDGKKPPADKKSGD
ncbi:MAG TPA: hypothetical protein VGJ05_07230 [Fimbriiglobus sp.]